MTDDLWLGPPASPLPGRWWRGLTRRQIARVVRCELRGAPRVMPQPHEKGYVRLYLGRGHPYADRGGTQHLHRWLVQRQLGQRLPSYCHVHHTNGDKATIDQRKLQVLEAVEHGTFHYGRHFIRGERGRLVWRSCGLEMTESELEATT